MKSKLLSILLVTTATVLFSLGISIHSFAQPTITLTSPIVCKGTTYANLPYKATGSPDQYEIAYDATAHTAGFTDVNTWTALPSSPVILTIPGTATPATYNGTITVKNSSSGLTGSQAFTVTINATPLTFGAITGTSSVCGIGGSTSLSLPIPTGGTITKSGSYRIHTFTSNGIFTVPAGFNANYDVLVVAGGGGGGGNGGGGGGAGGYIYTTGNSLSAGSYTVTVGAGGGTSTTGTNSSFGSIIIANGGGGGASRDGGIKGKTGGSGGGGANGDNNSTECTPGIGTSGQGNAGGSGTNTLGCGGAGGGGGGAGGVGGNASGSTGGAGGIGVSCSISGTTATYAVGGAGGAPFACGGATGSNGGANTGSGGGANDGTGGSGIVIVRYPDITAGTWSSSDTGVATVNSSTGLVTGVSGGTTTISYTVTLGSCTSQQTQTINVSPGIPAAAGTITGTQTVCQEQNAVSYSVGVISDAISYIWAYTGTGATINGTTNNITIGFASTATSGNLTVQGTNSCGNGTVSDNYYITINPLVAAAGTISGTASVCSGQTGVSYTVPLINNATSYIWTYSGTGATINGTTNSITIDFTSNATGGNLTVQGNNSCGNGATSPNYAVTVMAAPVTFGAITGTSSICNIGGTTSLSLPVPTGGTITKSGGYRIHKFTSSGTFTIPAGFNANYDVLVVAGGGGGGGNGGGGGGAGGYKYSTGYSLSAGSYTVTVGGGGAGQGNSTPNSGSSSSFGSIISTNGGGGGASRDYGGNALPGGSGGGGSSGNANGTGIAGQGNDGGIGFSNNCNSTGGGGGGAGSAGANGITNIGGNGGSGSLCPITGLYYAGGGGGGCTCYNPSTGGTGGTGGGGNGAGTSTVGTPGTANSGGGGGGGGAGNIGGSGGSGIVIVRYQDVTSGVWSSSNTGVATVNPSTDVATGVSFGTATISYTLTWGNCTDQKTSLISVNPDLPVSILIGADANPVCTEIPVTFTAYTVNEGTSPLYQWKVNGSNAGSNSSTFTYTPADNDAVTCILTSNVAPCATGNPATSNIITMKVNQYNAVSLTIGASPAGPVCSGTQVTCTATPVNEGTSPLYQWKVNGSDAGTNSSTYSFTPADNDSITCLLTSNAICPTGNPAVSDTIIMAVNSIIPPAPAAGSNSPVCTTGMLNLYATTLTDASYNWTGPGGFTSALQNPSISAVTTDAAGTYIVTATVRGCTSSAATTNVTINTTPASPIAGSDSPQCAGSILNLFASLISGVTYNWTGPDNFTSALQNPSISEVTTNATGTYSVTTTVNGCTSPASSTDVTINAIPPAPVAGSDSPKCLDNTLNLTASLIPGAAYIWTGPDNFTSTIQNPSISGLTTDAAGIYSVTATVNGCNNSAGTTIVTIINIKTPSPAAGNNGPVCEGSALSLTTSTVTGATYTWTGPDSFTSTLQNPSIPAATTDATGIYSVTATANGCMSLPGATSATVNYIPAAPTAGNNGPVCEGSALSLTASTMTGATYNWTGPDSFTSALQNPVISAATTNATGNYFVTATVNGCTSVAGTTSATVNPIPPSPAADNNGPVCVGSVLSLTASTVTDATYIWTGPDSFTSTLQNPVISGATTNATGNYSVTAKVSGCTSLAGTTNATVNSIPAAPIARNNGPVCIGTALSLTATLISGATYVWTGPNGFTSSSQNPSVSSSAAADMAGTYSVTATVSGCTGPAGTTSVTVNTIPSEPTAGNNGPVCEGTALSLTASTVTGATYNWSGPNNFTSSLQNPTVSSSATTAMAGNYSVTVTVNGCTGPAGTTSVTIKPISITVTSPTVCIGATSANLPYSVTGSPYQYSIAYNTAAHTAGFSDIALTSLTVSPIVLAVPGNAAPAAYNGIISVSDSSTGCTASHAFTVAISAPPITIDDITGTSSICINGMTTLSCNVPTGGTITITKDGLYRINTFTSSGTFIALASGNYDILVVGGGGGGGQNGGGGGGAGGLKYSSGYSLNAGSYSVTVGDGGAGSAGNHNTGSNGGNSGFGGISAFIALGGGGGASRDGGGVALSGGSGGGGSSGNGAGAGTAGQGNAGGNGYNNGCPSSGGGGGGAGAAGTAGTSNHGGNGGIGKSYDISGTSVYYAGGGAGGPTCPNDPGYYGTGGNGGGSSGNGVDGTPNTGGGGSGGYTVSAKGGSGIVIVRTLNSPLGVWSSSNTGVAAIDVSGNVTGVSAGTAIISYTVPMGVCSNTRTFPLTVSSDFAPGIISVVPDTRCGAGIVNLQAIASAGIVNWYDAGGNLLVTGNTYSPYISATTTFYVDATNNGCTSAPRTAVLATRIIDNTPPASVNTDQNNFCAGTVAKITLTATGGCGQTLNWFAGSCGGTVIGTGTSLTITAPSITTTYYASYKTDGSSGCTSVTVMVYNHTIVTHPVNPPSICTGTGSAMFSITAAGTALTYQWQVNKNDGNGWNNLNSAGSNPVYSGWNSSELQLTGIVVSDNGYQFRCILNDTICPHPVISGSASLIVGNSASIINQTASESRCGGDTVSLKIYAAGAPAPTYQWQKDEQNITNATLNSYFIPLASISDAGNYICTVSNFCKSVKSNPISLMITMPVNVSFITGNKVKCVGDSAIFIVSATGSPISYQWSKNGTPITGATHTSYLILQTSFSDAGSYSCDVSNSCNEVNLNTSLTVNPKLVIQDTIPDQAICQGNNVTFTVNAAGTSLSYQWTKNSIPITGATLTSYLIPYTSSSDAGTYSCNVNNGCSIKSLTPFTLTVNAPPVFQLPASNFQLHVGDSVNIACNLSEGSPPLTYQWTHDGNNIDNATLTSYFIPHTSISDSGTYSCKVSNVCGNITAKIATLTVFNQGQYTVSGNVNYDNNAKTPMSNTTVYLNVLITNNYELIDSARTDNTGAYIFNSVNNGNYRLTCRTTKARGGSNPLDALIVNRKFIGVYVITDPLKLKAADVNNDTKINPLDALIINRRFIGSLKKFAIPDWLFETPSITVNGANVTQNIKSICAGDVNGSYPSKYYDEILDIRY